MSTHDESLLYVLKGNFLSLRTESVSQKDNRTRRERNVKDEESVRGSVIEGLLHRYGTKKVLFKKSEKNLNHMHF